MNITVKVRSGSYKQSLIVKDGIYTVSLCSKPYKNAANIELIEILSKEFNIAKSYITIVKGHKSKNKIVNIDIDENSGKGKKKI